MTIPDRVQKHDRIVRMYLIGYNYCTQSKMIACIFLSEFQFLPFGGNIKWEGCGAYVGNDVMNASNSIIIMKGF